MLQFTKRLKTIKTIKVKRKLMIKKVIIAGCMAVTALVGCDKVRRSPGHAYMPDMADSKAYETYAPAQERLDQSSAAGAHYNGLPVAGTIARGEMMHYKLKNDSAGYAMSASVKNPLDIAQINMKEAERLYLINCGICHGTKLDGNGPLFNGGNGPFTAAPKDFTGADMKAMTEGTMFHAVTYGKGQMGSYASQLNPAQRWMVIAYVKAKQGGNTSAAATDSIAAPKADSTVTK
jgi:mono/diheme cytochrome c family protein